MIVLDPGHDYMLNCLDTGAENPGPLSVRLTFVKREGEGYPGNVGHHAGTNIQEVLRALIDRLKYLDNQISCVDNTVVIENLRNSIFFLELRAAERHNRPLPSGLIKSMDIEDIPTCPKCGHIGCEGTCH